MEGRIKKFVSEQALMEQPFIRDTSKTVATVVKEAVAQLGEKISIRRFERWGCVGGVGTLHGHAGSLLLLVAQDNSPARALAGSGQPGPAAAIWRLHEVVYPFWCVMCGVVG